MELRCIIIDDEAYAIARLEELVQASPGVVHVKSFDNAFDAMNYLHHEGHIDLIFSDIGMPFINGIEAAKLLKPYCDFLVFITGHRDYGEESYEVGVDGYLLKPLIKLKFIQLVQRLLNSKEKEEHKDLNRRSMLMKGNSKNNYLNVHHDEIIYVKAMSNYVKVITEEGLQTTHLTLTEMERKLEHVPQFLRIHRSVIISFNYVKEIEGFNIILKNKEKFTVGRSYKKLFEDFLKKRIAG